MFDLRVKTASGTDEFIYGCAYFKICCGALFLYSDHKGNILAVINDWTSIRDIVDSPKEDPEDI